MRGAARGRLAASPASLATHPLLVLPAPRHRIPEAGRAKHARLPPHRHSLNRPASVARSFPTTSASHAGWGDGAPAGASTRLGGQSRSAWRAEAALPRRGPTHRRRGQQQQHAGAATAAEGFDGQVRGVAATAARRQARARRPPPTTPPPRTARHSLGCPKNTVDGEVLLGDLYRSVRGCLHAVCPDDCAGRHARRRGNPGAGAPPPHPTPRCHRGLRSLTCTRTRTR